MKYKLNKNYKSIDIADFYSECAIVLANEKTNADKFYDASVVHFINTICVGDYAMYVDDIYTKKHRNISRLTNVKNNDIKNVALNAKLLYLQQIKMSPSINDMLNNDEMYGHLTFNFSIGDVLKCIDKFLISSAKLFDVEISKQDLKEVETNFNMQNDNLEH